MIFLILFEAWLGLEDIAHYSHTARGRRAHTLTGCIYQLQATSPHISDNFMVHYVQSAKV